MSKLIKRAISKAEISVLPVVTFEGRIVAIQTVTDAEKAIDYLLTQKMVGVDTETRPSFVKVIKYLCYRCLQMKFASCSG